VHANNGKAFRRDSIPVRSRTVDLTSSVGGKREGAGERAERTKKRKKERKGTGTRAPIGEVPGPQGPVKVQTRGI